MTGGLLLGLASQSSAVESPPSEFGHPSAVKSGAIAGVQVAVERSLEAFAQPDIGRIVCEVLKK
jgi:hypothetical protein